MELAGGKALRDYWSILVRRRWAIYLAVATVGLTALVASFVVTPQYRSTATLQIERQNPDIFTFRDLAQVDQSWSAYADFYQTQYRIIGSTAVARKAVEQLGLLSHPEFNEPASTGFNPLSWLRSLIPRRESEVEMSPVDIAALQVLGGLTVEPVRNSHLVEISWESPHAELTAQVANAVTRAYVLYNLEAQFSTSGQAEEFLLNQIATVEGEINELETGLQRYGETKRIVSVDEANNITFKALQDIAAKRTQAQTALAQIEAEHRSVMQAAPEALPELLNSDLVDRLRQEYSNYEAEYSEKARQFKDDWPGMQTLASKLEQSRRRLELETERIASQVRAAKKAEYDEALAEVRNLSALLVAQEDAAQNLKRDAVQFVTLRNEVRKKRETLAGLIRRQNEMALSTRIQDPESVPTNIRVVEAARTPIAPFRPNTKMNLLLGLFFGMVIGVGTALLLDYLDNTITSAEQLSRLVSLPLLAVIPRHGTGGGRLLPVPRKETGPESGGIDYVAQKETRSWSAEAYRELRTSILLSSAGRPPRQIVITSSFPEEGKTATAINLAVVLAQLGRRILLVDADLRRPRLHRSFHVPQGRGVSTYLSGLQDDFEGLIQKSPVDNLDLLCSGPIPPNPSELLNSPRFVQMGQTLLDRGYDHVVYDSPPVLSVSDAVIVANSVDLGILVVRASRTPRQSIRTSADRFEHSGGASFGVLLNDLDVDARGSTYRSYRHYGRYGEQESPSTEEPDRVGSAGA